MFKTVDSEFTKSGKSLALFKKEWYDLKNDFVNAKGLTNKVFSLFSTGLTNDDILRLKEYNNLINKGQNSQSAYYRTLTKASSAAQNLAAQANGAAVSEELLTERTNALTFAQKALSAASKVAGTALRMVFNVGVGLAINFIISFISKAVNYQKELNEKIKELGQTAKDTSKDVSSLYAEYLKLNEAVANGTGSKEDLKSATDNLLDALGLEGIAVDELIQKYKSLEEAMTQISIEKLKEAHNNLVSSKDVYKDELLKAGGSTFWGDNTFKFLSTDNDLLFKNINGKGVLDVLKAVKGLKYTTESNRDYTSYAFTLLGDPKTVEGIKQNYETLMAMQDALIAKFGADEAGKLDIYTKITDRLTTLKTAYENYTNEITALNDSAAKIAILEGLKGKELPKTQEEFKAFFDDLINDATTAGSELRNQFIGTDKEIENSIKSALSGMSVFDDFTIDPIPVDVSVLPSVSADTSGLRSSLDTLKEQIDDIFKNTNLFDEAIKSLKEGESLDLNTVMAMVEVDSSLAGKFTKTADGYTIAVHTLTKARQDYTKATTESIQADIVLAKQSIAAAEENIRVIEEKKNRLLSNGINSVGDADLLDKYNAGIQSEKDNIDKLNNAIDQYILLLGGVIDANSDAVSSHEKLQNAIENSADKTSLLKSAMEEMADNGYISAETYAELAKKGDKYVDCLEIQNGRLVLNIEKLKELEIQEYANAIAANELAIAQIRAATSGHQISASLQAEIDSMQRDNAIYRQLIEDYNNTTPDNDKGDTTDTNKDEFDKLYSEKKHDLEMNRISEEEFINWLDGAYKEYFSDLTKYQDEYNKYEEEVYKSRKDREQELFDLKMDNHKKLADNALEGKIDIDKFNKDMQAEYGLGNVDLTKRPKVKMEDGSTATVLSASEFVWQGDEENGKYVVVHYTPILPDGTILDDDTLNDYLYNTLENSENILDTDKNGLGIVLKVDTDFDISDEDVRSLETDKPTENIQNIIAACDEWDVALHEIQEDWVELTDAVSGDDIAARFDYARNEINAAIANTQARIDELSLIPGSEDEIAKLRDDLDGLYDVLEDIDDKERESEIDYIEKQKDNFTDTIDQHIDDIEREADAVEKVYDKRIEAIDKQADAYDKQADSIDKEIEAIEKTNEAEKRKTDILEAQKKVKEAELELEKAHVKNRLVYVGNGRYEAKEDKDAVKEAEENLANAKAELAEKLQEEQVDILKDQKADIEAQKDILEEQKSVIEEAKDNADEYYSDIKDNLEQQKDTGEKTYDALIDILENADGEAVQNTSNSDLYNRLAGTDDLKKAVDGLSPSEKQAAFDSGLLSVDGNGNYSLDYTAVDDNSQAVKDNTAATENLDNTLQKFMPEDYEGDKADVTETADNNKSKVKPVTYTEWKKRHTLSEYAPNGKDVPNMTFEEYFRQLTGDKKSGKSNDITKSIEDYFKEITGIDISKYSNTPTASENFGNAMKGIIGDIFTGNNENVVNNVSDTHNDPQFNCTINIEGSADEKTVERMKNEINSALNEYTTELKASLHRSLINQRYKP